MSILDAELLDALGPWLAGRRWYTGKGREPRLTAVSGLRLDETSETWLVRDDAGPEPVLYQVPLTRHPGPVAGLEGALVATGPAGWVYDGCQDPGGAAALLRAITGERRLDPVDGRGTGTGHRAGAAPVPTGSRVLSGEQSNTSVIYDVADGEPVILKVFRVLHPGYNPDVEVQQALASAGSTRVPRPVGDLVGRWPVRDAGPPDAVTGAGETLVEGHLALAQEFLPGVEDAWRVALRAATAGEDFTDRARALGEATAEVHAVLARVLPTRAADDATRAATLRGWQGRQGDAVAHVPALADRAEEIDAVLRAGAGAPWPRLQRVHGDYHLGQVLDVPGRGWVLLDFEGEPLRPLAQRTEPDLPQRDVAGMLRSFDYAAASAADAPAGWATAAREAFLDGYAAASGTDPRAEAELLRALELDKALYEAVYEARNRPDWLPIPLAGIERILAGAAGT
jgi:predicted trehalose synthase